ncbi:MAG TPA: glutathione S-transferase family protein [Kofleriaceae bacterium]|nr:glutathione S-transferase family protein [Kofleriaceae bacterium]
MITLHAFGRVNAMVHGLTRDLRVQWALEELGLPYEVRGVDHDAGETKEDAFGELSPFHQIPVIEDDGMVLSESGAILVYLAEKAGLANARTRAQVMRWCFAALSTVEPVIQMIVLDDFGKKTDPVSRERRAGLVKWAEQVIGRVEKRLGEQAFVAGEEFTVADILMVTVLRQARRAGLLAKFPRGEAYRRTCEARPAWGRTVAAYEKRLGAEPGAVARAVEPAV